MGLSHCVERMEVFNWRNRKECGGCIFKAIGNVDVVLGQRMLQLVIVGCSTQWDPAGLKLNTEWDPALAFPPKQVPFALAWWVNRLGVLEAVVGQLSLAPSSLKAPLLLRHWGIQWGNETGKNIFTHPPVAVKGIWMHFWNLHWHNSTESEVTGINFCCARIWVLRSAWLWAIWNILLSMRRDKYQGCMAGLAE